MLFSRWAWSRVARPCLEALRSGGVRAGRVAVVGRLPLARALAGGELDVVAIVGEGTPLRRWDRGAARADPAALPLGDGAVDAVIGAPVGDGAAGVLREWARVARVGGLVVLVQAGGGAVSPEEATRLLLCAGLVDLEQRSVGRTLVTSGRVEEATVEGRPA